MKEIERKAARKTVAKARVSEMSPSNRIQILQEWWSLQPSDEGWAELPRPLREELGGHRPTALESESSKYDPLLELAALQETHGVTNSWLEKKLSEITGTSEPWRVLGDPEKMAECPCCNYLTIREQGEYDICPVCFWEDDGTQGLDQVSCSNHMTLREAKKNFGQFGACSKDAGRHVIAEARFMYPQA